jgi:hypothetical protein
LSSHSFCFCCLISSTTSLSNVFSHKMFEYSIMSQHVTGCSQLIMLFFLCFSCRQAWQGQKINKS